MKLIEAVSGSGSDKEISALIDVLHQSAQRLEDLTGGEVDSVADREGRTILLRHAQDQLRAREAARQAAILDALPAHTALLDGDGRILAVNEAWRLFKGGNSILGPDHGVDSNYLEILDTARDGDAFAGRQAAEGIRSVLDGAANSFSIEYPCHSRTRDRWFLMTATPLHDTHGNGAVIMHLDITAQRRGEASLRRLGAALDVIEDAVYLVDRTSMKFVHINETACRMQSRTREEMMALGPDGILSVSLAELERSYDAIIASGVDAEPMELLRPRKDAPDAWVELRRHAVRSGDRWTIVTLVRDITEQVARREQLLRFRTAMDFSGDAILLIDRASLRYIDVNQTFCDMVGRTREELLGMTPMDVFSTDRETLERDYDALIADNAAAANSVEGEYRHSDGSVVPIETRRRAMHTDQGWVIVATARDLTKRKMAERRIAYLNRVLGVLSGINTLIVRVRDRNELFREACRIAVEGGGFRTALICELDQSGGTIVPVASAGLDVALMAEIRGMLASPETAGATMIARAMRKKKAIVSNDSQSDPQALLRGKHGESGVRSLAVLPLIVAGEAIGALALYAGEVEFFHAEEMRSLTELAGDISFALDNLGRQRKIATLSRIRAVSGEIDAAVIRAADGEALFREACRIIVEVGGLKMAWVGVTDPRTHVVRPVASHGDHAEDYLRVAGIAGDGASTHGRGPTGTASNSDQPVWCDDFCHDPLTAPWHAQGVRLGWKSSAALPLHQDGRLVGVLSLYAGEVAAFDAEEQQLLLETAGRISFALDYIKKAERLRYLAYHDELTGLANRSQYLERVALHVRNAASRGHGLAVFLIDLERFKNINDTLGRPAGDLLLQQVADWLGRNLGNANLIARISADQFALVLPEIRRDGDLVRLLEKTMAAFAEHVFVQGDMQLRVAVRVGVAIFPEDGTDADTLFRNAEAALKKAKVDGDRYLFHTRKMTEAAAGRLALENQLREALDKEQFELHYQPKVTLAGGKLTGVEALIRWNDPRTGLVPPGRFIPILEETGMINDVGRWALRRAIRDYLRWRAAGLPAVRIAVNVSPLQLRNRGFIAEIEQVIGIDPHAPAGLELEITESLIMSDVSLSIASLRSIRALGVSVAIDDFGTGFSSLAYLAKLPVDTLKIDRSFVIDMTSGPQGLALVSTIINLAHSLKLKVVAEGVETEEQSRLLRLLGCDEMQGYLFSRPVPAEIFEQKFLAPPVIS